MVPVNPTASGSPESLTWNPLSLPVMSARGFATPMLSEIFCSCHTADPSPANGLSRSGSDNFMLIALTVSTLPVRSSR